MSKQRFSIQVTEEQYYYLKRQDNASALIRRLIDSHMKGADVEQVGLRVQEQVLKEEAEAALEKHQRLRSQMEDIQDLRESISERESAKLQEAREELADTPKEPTNDAIQNWADQLGMRPAELCNHLQQDTT